MKASADNPYEDDLDPLLFAYVEGNLTEKEARQLEEKLAADASLQTELEHWKESFVTQDFLSTDKLEQTLLKEKTNPANPAASTFIFVLALTAFLLSFLPLSENKTRITDQPTYSVPESLPVPKKAAEIRQPAQLIMEKVQDHTISPGVNTAKPVARTIVHPEEIIIQHLPVTSVLPTETSQPVPVIAIPETHMKKLIAKKISVRRIITRQERRKILQMKERALQQRKANGFMKGNVPYVVPLNTTNF